MRCVWGPVPGRCVLFSMRCDDIPAKGTLPVIVAVNGSFYSRVASWRSIPTCRCLFTVGCGVPVRFFRVYAAWRWATLIAAGGGGQGVCRMETGVSTSFVPGNPTGERGSYRRIAPAEAYGRPVRLCRRGSVHAPAAGVPWGGFLAWRERMSGCFRTALWCRPFSGDFCLTGFSMIR